MAVLTLLGGLALVVSAVALVAAGAPDGARDLRAYQAAQRCPAAPVAPAECRWTQVFTVSHIALTKSKSKSNRAVLTSADGARWETFYASRGPVLNGLDEGDRVTGTLWRGRLTEIAAAGASQETRAAPVDTRAGVLIGALIIVPPGLLMMATGIWRLRRRTSPPTPGMVATLGLAFGLLVGGLFCPVLVGDNGDEFWPVAAAWLAVAAVLAIVARLHVSQERASARVSSP
ncbi:hypothetical protein ACFQU9_20860 [Actinomadura namibiensis]|uniref:Putative membrane protein n=1 Tax=Actinomadura namibiensis TaxID=182080 RepID=A0A7W3QMJ6_ACTNM|nr:hypothetical protein [Actinomadura namibiensis]MBA8952630.1 putative membrane protein [Actinomadura namibiensis]